MAQVHYTRIDRTETTVDKADAPKGTPVWRVFCRCGWVSQPHPRKRDAEDDEAEHGRQSDPND